MDAGATAVSVSISRFFWLLGASDRSVKNSSRFAMVERHSGTPEDVVPVPLVEIRSQGWRNETGRNPRSWQRKDCPLIETIVLQSTREPNASINGGLDATES